MKLAGEPCHKLCHLKSPERQFICVLETIVWLMPFGKHLMPTKNLDQSGGAVRKEGVGIVCSGVILRPNWSQASDTPVPPGIVWTVWQCVFSHVSLVSFFWPRNVEGLVPPSTSLLPAFMLLRLIRIWYLSFLGKRKLQYFLSYCFMGSLHFYNMTVGKCQVKESKIVKLLF